MANRPVWTSPLEPRTSVFVAAEAGENANFVISAIDAAVPAFTRSAIAGVYFPGSEAVNPPTIPKVGEIAALVNQKVDNDFIPIHRRILANQRKWITSLAVLSLTLRLRRHGFRFGLG